MCHGRNDLHTRTANVNAPFLGQGDYEGCPAVSRIRRDE